MNLDLVFHAMADLSPTFPSLDRILAVAGLVLSTPCVLALIAHTAVCSILLFAVFCRAVRSDADVLFSIRLSFFGLALATGAVLIAPWRWNYEPRWLDIFSLLAMFFVLLSTARNWYGGIPQSFTKKQHRRRACDPKEELA